MKSMLTNNHISIHTRRRLLHWTHFDVWMRGLDNFKTGTKVLVMNKVLWTLFFILWVFLYDGRSASGWGARASNLIPTETFQAGFSPHTIDGKVQGFNFSLLPCSVATEVRYARRSEITMLWLSFIKQRIGFVLTLHGTSGS